MRLHGTSRINELNHLTIGGCDAVQLVEKHGTPLYVMDEELIRKNCREYRESFGKLYDKIKVAYAGKAFLNLAMCRIVDEEGLFLDVVSGGELYTALKAGYPAERIIFHGNNKTVDEHIMALTNSVGIIVVDNFNELYRLDKLAGKYNKKADIYLRVSPGIEAHTHDYIKTGQIDSKFGFPIINGQAQDAAGIAISLDNLNLKGIHCHIGSQIFETEPYKDAVDALFNFANQIKTEWGHEVEDIDIGGGFGIYYSKKDKPVSKDILSKIIIERVKENIKLYGFKDISIVIEPGRSIVGNAGTTLYKIGAVKEIPDVRKYIAVDGGMADNIRPALYSAEYEAAIANRMEDLNDEVVTIAGKCCESADILIRDIQMPKVNENDILAIFSTGAYGQSMSSNYNRIPKPAVVLVYRGQSYIISKRETYDELIMNDIIPEKLGRI
jgi:diaminopimelate decarboxylase